MGAYTRNTRLVENSKKGNDKVHIFTKADNSLPVPTFETWDQSTELQLAPPVECIADC